MTLRLTFQIGLLILKLMCSTLLKGTNQFTANCGLKQQSQLSPCFYKDMIYVQPFEKSLISPN